ncbi:MAG TPA: amidohydrolase family protein [Vicinamibacterales bacterium]|nr:amidohydrolase family protein [Vicinamibacterales bacterium]
MRVWAAVAVISLQSAVVSLQSPVVRLQAQGQALAITHVTVIDTAKGTAAADMTVVMRGDRIVSVDKGMAAPAGAQVIDGRGKFVIPGLWDMHTHLSYARATALPALAATGVAYVRDVGSDLSEIDEWRGEIAAGRIVGPTILRAGPILNGQASNQYHLVIANAADARMAARTLKKVGVDVLKTHRRTSREAYFALADEAKKIGIPLVGHVPMTVSPAEASDAGQQTLEHIETLFEGTFASAHDGQVRVADVAAWRTSPDAAALFATFVRNGTVVDPTLIAQGYLARTLDSPNQDPRLRYVPRSALELRDRTLAGLPALQKAGMPPLVRENEAVALQLQRAGVTLVTGTDLAFLHPPGFSLHDELDMFAEAGLTPAEILRAATTNCAKLFPSLDGGAVSPRKRADLVLLNANPLTDIRNVHDIHAVVLRGRLLNRATLDRTLADAAVLAANN